MEEEFTDYRDEKDMNNAEALRELVRAGLSEKRADPLDDRPDTRLAGLLWDARRDLHTFVLITVLSLAFWSLTTGLVSLLFLTVSVLYALTVTVGTIDAVLLDSRTILWLTERSNTGTAEVEA
jgi:hypothetical protein